MFAAIDVGSNTVRMLIGTVDPDGHLVPETHRRAITRLRGGYCPAEGLSSKAMERTLFALREFAAELTCRQIDRVAAVGTAALRQAVNGRSFVDRVRSETGLVIEIVAGDREARLAAAGAMAALDPVPQRALIFDIGGGSTEFILVEKGNLRFQRSYALGVVSLSEECPDEHRLGAEICSHLDTFEADLAEGMLLGQVKDPACCLVGTAGTVTTLAALRLGMAEYDWRRVNNLVLEGSILHAWHERLTPLSVAEREKLPGLEKGRGDLILPGLKIILALLDRLDKKLLTVSDFGLLEGLLLSLHHRD